MDCRREFWKRVGPLPCEGVRGCFFHEIGFKAELKRLFLAVDCGAAGYRSSFFF